VLGALKAEKGRSRDLWALRICVDPPELEAKRKTKNQIVLSCAGSLPYESVTPLLANFPLIRILVVSYVQLVAPWSCRRRNASCVRWWRLMLFIGNFCFAVFST
jgi:hypothetical protein